MRDYDDEDRYDRGYDDTPRGGSRGRMPRRDMDFDNDEFGGSGRGLQRGQRDRDWADDFDERDGGRSRRAPMRGNVRQADEDYGYDTRSNRSGRRGCREEDEYEMKPRRSFRKRHPVLMNFIYVCAASCVAIWLLLLFLDYWTFHGEERMVPDVKGQAYANAAGNVDLAGLRPVLSDSVFDAYAKPGTVVEQMPIPGAKIKKGGSVYMTIVAFSPKLVTVPDFYNASVRQARSMFEGLGIREVREVPVLSEYSGLVLGAKFNGVSLQPGARIPVSAVVTLEVGTGIEEELETGADVDTLAIDDAIEELDIE